MDPSPVAAAPDLAPLAARAASFADAVGAVLRSALDAAHGFDVERREAFEQGREAARAGLLRALDELLAPQIAALQLDDARRERAQHRQRAVDELSATEDDYLKDLLVLQNVWEPEFRRSNVISTAARDLGVMFGSLRQLVGLSADIAHHLATIKALPPAEQRIGEVFKKRIPFLKGYIEYCKGQVLSTDVLQNAARSPKYKELTDRVRATNPAVRNLDMAAFLIKPTQRITKYPLFLTDLVRSTDEGHQDYRNLVDALDEMHRVLAEINRKTSECESHLLVQRMLPVLAWRSDPVVDLQAAKLRLVREGRVVSVVRGLEENERGNYLYLFDNLLLVCQRDAQQPQPQRIQELAFMPLTGAGVAVGLETSVVTNGFVTVTIVHNDAMDRIRWGEKIERAIAQSTGLPNLPLLPRGGNAQSQSPHIVAVPGEEKPRTRERRKSSIGSLFRRSKKAEDPEHSRRLSMSVDTETLAATAAAITTASYGVGGAQQQQQQQQRPGTVPSGGRAAWDAATGTASSDLCCGSPSSEQQTYTEVRALTASPRSYTPSPALDSPRSDSTPPRGP
eukprot:m51a1_g12850 putative domain containing protein (565) ;mRNA; f:733-3272